MNDLFEKVVIITGGANGIGYETAKMFCDNGAIVYVFDIDKLINKKNYLDKIKYIKCDVSNNEDVMKSIDYVFLHEHKIDVLINNAAIQFTSEFVNYSDEEYLKVIKTNFIGTCNCIHNVLKYMNDGSTILNILSVHSSKPRTNKFSYDCSKSSLECLTKELALELASRKISVNALSFGAVETNMNLIWKENPVLKQEALSKVPLKIIFTPKQIAFFISIIIKNFSSYTTGSIFVIDGGRSLM